MSPSCGCIVPSCVSSFPDPLAWNSCPSRISGSPWGFLNLSLFSFGSTSLNHLHLCKCCDIGNLCNCTFPISEHFFLIFILFSVWPWMETFTLLVRKLFILLHSCDCHPRVVWGWCLLVSAIKCLQLVSVFVFYVLPCTDGRDDILVLCTVYPLVMLRTTSSPTQQVGTTGISPLTGDQECRLGWVLP